jgi:hypothetical protein
VRRLPVLVVALLAATLLPACSTEDDDADELRAALERTERLASRFGYTETHDDARVTVRGLIEDDFRYKARLAVDGRDTLDEVVDDDALYFRLIDAASLDLFLAEDADLSVESDLEGVTVAEVLRARRWLVDRDGAPAVFGTASVEEGIGEDPVRDALAVLKYAEKAIGEAAFVVKYNPESLDYKPSEDPFPTPEDGSGVTRYDFLARPFPRPDSAASTGEALADTPQFRKMSVYVKDGLVFQVMEQIGAAGDVADRFVRYLRSFLFQSDQEAFERFESSYEQVPPNQRSALILGIINDLRAKAGEDPVRGRSMTFELVDLGQDVTIDVPDGAVEGELNILRARGRQEVVSDSEKV